MKVQLIGAVTAGLVALTTAGCASTGKSDDTDAYPRSGKPITLIVGWDSGGGTDISARLLAQQLEKKLDTRIIVKNVPGGSSQIGSEQLATSSPDGYTITMVNAPTTQAIYSDTERGAKFDKSSFAVVANHDSDPVGLAVRAKSDIKDLDDLAAAAKDRKIKVANSGLYSAVHLGTLLLAKDSGIKFDSVVFDNGGQMRSALLNGDIDVEAGTLSELLPAQEDGQVRVIASLGGEAASAPDAPATATDQGYPIVMESNRMIAVPRDTPTAVIDRLSTAIGEILASQEYKDLAAKQKISLNYLDSKDATALWNELDASTPALVAAFKAKQ